MAATVMLSIEDSPEIALISERVPEFQPVLKDLATSWGDVDVFLAMTELAKWVAREAQRGRPSQGPLTRTFQAIEDLVNDQELTLGRDLAVDFLETLSTEDPAVRSYAGPWAADWLDRYG